MNFSLTRTSRAWHQTSSCSPGRCCLSPPVAMIATASVLHTTITGISRIVFSMARNNDLPQFLSRISPRFSTPHYTIRITGFFMVAAVLVADLALVVAVSTFAMLIFYFIADVAALRLPRDTSDTRQLFRLSGPLRASAWLLFLKSIPGLSVSSDWRSEFYGTVYGDG
jgi:basic amino acid/polyamine antiporter, APA family